MVHQAGSLLDWLGFFDLFVRGLLAGRDGDVFVICKFLLCYFLELLQVLELDFEGHEGSCHTLSSLLLGAQVADRLWLCTINGNALCGCEL